MIDVLPQFSHTPYRVVVLYKKLISDSENSSYYRKFIKFFDGF